MHRRAQRAAGQRLRTIRGEGDAPDLLALARGERTRFLARLDVPDTDGFVVDEAEVTWWGYCPACQRLAETGPQRPADEEAASRSPRG